MSLAPVEALTMADMRNLLDLPNELLAIIFRFHFEQVKVGIVYLREGQRRNTTKTKFFLSAMLSCKPLGQIAQREFLRHVELVVNEFDWCSEYLDKPHWRNAKKTIMPALVPAPFEFIRNVMSSIEAFLPLLEAGDSRESGLNDFTNLESLVIVDTLKYRSGNFDLFKLDRILDLTRLCANKNIKLYACIRIVQHATCSECFLDRNVEVNTFKFTLTQDEVIRPFSAVMNSYHFYFDVKNVLERLFRVPKGAMKRFTKAWKVHMRARTSSTKKSCLPVMVHQDVEEDLVWRAKPVESFQATTRKVDAGRYWIDDCCSLEAKD